ncbi:MAG: transglycosylase domain-containing protein [Actinomycetota bacterium]
MARTPRTRPLREELRALVPTDVDPALPAVLAMTMVLAAIAVAFAFLPVAITVGDTMRAVERRLDLAGAGFSRVPGFPERSTIYAADGSVLSSLYLDEDRDIVSFEDIPQVARDAVLAIEDDGYYEHGAVNVTSIVRAVLANLAAGDITQGGSTITQQLVKKAVIGDSRQTFSRKFQEMAIGIRLEKRYTKDEILALYLNEVYFGNGVYGIGTASRYYFGIPASDLSLPQAALLAGLIRSPATYDPIAHPDDARDRRDLVLSRMDELGWASDAEVEAAKGTPIELHRGAGQSRKRVQPFFVFFLTRSMLDMDDHRFDVLGTTYDQRVHTIYQGGLDIHTTLMPSWQRAAQKAVVEDTDLSPDAGVGPDVALVSLDANDGAIRTMLSGKNYKRDKLDLVWRGRRQVGSAFKAITLAAAIEAGVPPTKTYESLSPYCDPRWKSEDGCVRNAEEEGAGGPIDLWAATAESVNVVFAQLALDIGPERIVDMAHRLGITSDLDAVPSITLGVEEVSTLEMASAYATLANEGVHCSPYAIARIELSDGDPIYEHTSDCEQVVEPDVAHLVTAMLQRVVNGGTGTAARLDRPVAGKTGTGSDYTNVYFAGYTPQVATAVWIGFPSANIPMDAYFGRSVFGGTLAAPLWHTFMETAVAGMPVEEFPPAPAGINGTVPNVLGMSVAEARSALVAFSTVFVERGTGTRDVILGQTPAAGTVLPAGSVVTLTVAIGTDVGPAGSGIGVPDLTGLPILEAIATLQSYGFTIRVIYPTGADIAGKTWFVERQSPDPGSPTLSSGQVTLWATLRAVTTDPATSPPPCGDAVGIPC